MVKIGEVSKPVASSDALVRARARAALLADARGVALNALGVCALGLCIMAGSIASIVGKAVS